MKNKTEKSSFTLIELLVVIAIIGILASLLMPALSMAKKSAKAIACTSNLKQLSTAAAMYAIDFNGFIPKQVATGTGVGWYQLGTNRYIEGKYIVRQTLICPSENVSLAEALAQDNGKQIFYYTYGFFYYTVSSNSPFNLILYTDGTSIWDGNTQGYYISKAKNTSKFPLYADTGQVAKQATFWYFHPSQASGNASLRLIHLQKANIAFIDGHVEAKGQELRDEPTYFANFVTEKWQIIP